MRLCTQLQVHTVLLFIVPDHQQLTTAEQMAQLVTRSGIQHPSVHAHYYSYSFGHYNSKY